MPNRQYYDTLACEGRLHVAELFSVEKKWNQAAKHFEKAHQVRPDNGDIMVKLFYSYRNGKNSNKARQTYKKLTKKYPKNLGYQILEVDLLLSEASSLRDFERAFKKLVQLKRQHPKDPEILSKGEALVIEFVPSIAEVSDKLSASLREVVTTIQRIKQDPNMTIDSYKLKQIYNDLKNDYQTLKNMVDQCFEFVDSKDGKKMLRDLREHINSKISLINSLSLFSQFGW